jgi:hypothetical protein
MSPTGATNITSGNHWLKWWDVPLPRDIDAQTDLEMNKSLWPIAIHGTELAGSQMSVNSQCKQSPKSPYGHLRVLHRVDPGDYRITWMRSYAKNNLFVKMGSCTTRTPSTITVTL